MTRREDPLKWTEDDLDHSARYADLRATIDIGINHGLLTVDGFEVRIEETTWNSGDSTFDVIRVSDGEYLTPDGGENHLPSAMEISQMLARAKPPRVGRRWTVDVRTMHQGQVIIDEQDLGLTSDDDEKEILRRVKEKAKEVLELVDSSERSFDEQYDDVLGMSWNSSQREHGEIFEGPVPREVRASQSWYDAM